MTFPRLFVLALCVSFIQFWPVSQAHADATFDYNAKGMELNRMRGRTLVGVTRDSSKTWSVYLDRKKKAYFTFSSGKTAEGTWSQKSKHIICFKGLNKDKPSDEVCKRAAPLGRGMDWMTIKLSTSGGKTTYQKATKGEQRGSSQIVYSFPGRDVVEPNSFVPDLRDWPGHILVGRRLKDKEPWTLRLGLDGKLRFAFITGQDVTGTYHVTKDQFCYRRDDRPNDERCRKMVIKSGKILWQKVGGGKPVSEVVFMRKVEVPGPRKKQVISDDSHHMVLVHPGSKTLAVVNRSKTGSIVLYDTHAFFKLGTIDRYARDLWFSPDGLKLLATYKKRVWQIDTRTGLIDWTAYSDGEEFSEVAYSLDGKRAVAGGSKGKVWVFDAADGTVVKTVRFGEAYVTDVASAAKDVMVATNTAGQVLVMSLKNDRAVVNTVSQNKLYMVRQVPGRAEVLISDNTGKLHLMALNPAGLKLSPVAVRDTKVGENYGYALSHDGRQVFLSGKTSSATLSLPALEVVDTYSRSKMPWLNSAEFLPGNKGLVGKYSSGGKSKGVEVWARDLTELAAMQEATSTQKTAARNRRKEISGAQKTAKSLYEQTKQASARLFQDGDCGAFAELQAQLQPEDRRTLEDCDTARETRRIKAEYQAALTALDCDAAQALREENGFGSQQHEDKCRAKVQFNQQKQQFADAMAAGDCDTIAALQDIVGQPGAAEQCAFDAALNGDSARKMFFTAVKFDTAKDRARAKQLYAAIMDRFPEDDLALQAATRLTALNDLEVMEQNQAENEAALKAAQDAVKAANEGRAKAEKEARKAAEQARRDAEKARADARAAEERAQRAQAQARQKQRRNTACDHVYRGQRVKKDTWLGGLIIYRVEGVNPRTGLATLVDTSNGYSKEVSCYDIP